MGLEEGVGQRQRVQLEALCGEKATGKSQYVSKRDDMMTAQRSYRFGEWMGRECRCVWYLVLVL